MLVKQAYDEKRDRFLQGQGLPHTALLEQRSLRELFRAYWRAFMPPCIITLPSREGRKTPVFRGGGSPHRLNRRLPARFLRLPLEGGVIFMGKP